MGKPLIKAIALKLGKGPAPDDEESDEPMAADEEGQKAAFKSLRKALESGDDAAGVTALKHFVSMCPPDSYDEDEGD